MKTFSRILIAAAVLATSLAYAAGTRDILLRVDGVACPFCAYGLEKKLERLDGVDDLDILINEGLVVLHLEEGATVDEALLRQKVKEAGFTPREITAKVVLDISGMDCDTCRERVEKALAELDCVEGVTIDIDAERAEVLCSDLDVDPAVFVAAVSKLGFDATFGMP